MNDLTTRNATWDDMVELLKAQKALAVDGYVKADKLRFKDGRLVITGTDPVLVDSGFIPVDGIYTPTVRGDATIAAKLDIPMSYLRRLREKAPFLYDANTNGLLRGKTVTRVGGEKEVLVPADERVFLVRLFRELEGDEGVLRALLSDRYAMIDNLDLLTAVTEGITQAGVEIVIKGCDVTETSMHVRAYSPQVAQLAPHFLSSYQNPFANPDLEKARRAITSATNTYRGAGEIPEDKRVVHAGFRFSNDECGAGRASFAPDIQIKVCNNGMTLPAFGLTKVHLGAKMSEGEWSLATQKKNLALITSQVKDKVAEWLSPEFLAARVEEIEEIAGAPVTRVEPTFKAIARQQGYTEAERDGILRCFSAGASYTAGGVANAVTAHSQTLKDADRAAFLDASAYQSMVLAAKV